MRLSGQRYSLISFLILSAVSLRVIAGCFDYKETLVLAPDLSGYIELIYTVPVHDGRSMIAFLPVSKENYLEQYSDAGEFQIESFTKEVLEETEDEMFSSRVKIKALIRFEDPSVLEGLLPGQTRVTRQKYDLSIQRIFPASVAPAEMGRLARNTYEITRSAFNGRKMEFNVVAPWYYDINSNHGTVGQPGRLYYVLPLERTLTQERPVVWKTLVKANPLPEVVP